MNNRDIIEYQVCVDRHAGVLVERPYCTELDHQTNTLIYRFCANHGCLHLMTEMLLQALQEQWNYDQYSHIEAARNLLEDGTLVFSEADCRRWRKQLEHPTLFDQ